MNVIKLQRFVYFELMVLQTNRTYLGGVSDIETVGSIHSSNRTKSLDCKMLSES